MNGQLADRVVDLLADGRAETVPGIARAVRARDDDVRELVTADPRFERRPAPAGRAGQARCYALTEKVVPQHGTSSVGTSTQPVGDTSSGTAEPREALWLLARVDGPRSVREAIFAAGQRRAA